MYVRPDDSNFNLRDTPGVRVSILITVVFFASLPRNSGRTTAWLPTTTLREALSCIWSWLSVEAVKWAALMFRQASEGSNKARS